MVELKPERARYMAERLTRATVICGDALDPEIFIEINIGLARGGDRGLQRRRGEYPCGAAGETGRLPDRHLSRQQFQLWAADGESRCGRRREPARSRRSRPYSSASDEGVFSPSIPSETAPPRSLRPRPSGLRPSSASRSSRPSCPPESSSARFCAVMRSSFRARRRSIQEHDRVVMLAMTRAVKKIEQMFAVRLEFF